MIKEIDLNFSISSRKVVSLVNDTKLLLFNSINKTI